MNNNITNFKILKNIFKNTTYRFALIGSVVITLLLPILAQQFVVPSFYAEMINNTLDDAKRVGRHIARHQDSTVTSTVLYTAIDKLRDDFKLLKIKLFDTQGKTIFSTTHQEIGTMNTSSYFFDVVAKGEIFYKTVKKGTNNSDGNDILQRDVAEIYVPILRDGKFAGSSEIYYDITDKKESFNKLMLKVNALYYIFSTAFFLFVISVLYNLSESNLKELLIEQSLIEKVDEKTKELQDINANLEKKIAKEILKNREKDTQLFQQSKLASMGEMISNIAHQWRQPLSAISSLASGIKIEKELGLIDDAELNRYLDKISQNTVYLSNTINDFRDFFKPDKEMITISLDKIFNSTLSIVESTLKNNNIEVVQNIDDVKFQTLSNELQQAILNIINNAKDALISNNIEKKYIFINSQVNDNSIVFSIYDNAGGVPENIINKVFEPYFTTKHQSQGTGIGLYMTKEIIQKHLKGDISVKNIEYVYQNKNYKGAEFSIKIFK